MAETGVAGRAAMAMAAVRAAAMATTLVLMAVLVASRAWGNPAAPAVLAVPAAVTQAKLDPAALTLLRCDSKNIIDQVEPDSCTRHHLTSPYLFT